MPKLASNPIHTQSCVIFALSPNQARTNRQLEKRIAHCNIDSAKLACLMQAVAKLKNCPHQEAVYHFCVTLRERFKDLPLTKTQNQITARLNRQPNEQLRADRHLTALRTALQQDLTRAISKEIKRIQGLAEKSYKFTDDQLGALAQNQRLRAVVFGICERNREALKKLNFEEVQSNPDFAFSILAQLKELKWVDSSSLTLLEEDSDYCKAFSILFQHFLSNHVWGRDLPSNKNKKKLLIELAKQKIAINDALLSYFNDHPALIARTLDLLQTNPALAKAIMDSGYYQLVAVLGNDMQRLHIARIYRLLSVINPNLNEPEINETNLIAYLQDSRTRTAFKLYHRYLAAVGDSKKEAWLSLVTTAFLRNLKHQGAVEYPLAKSIFSMDPLTEQEVAQAERAYAPWRIMLESLTFDQMSHPSTEQQAAAGSAGEACRARSLSPSASS